MKTSRLVRFWISCFSLSTSVPLRPMMMPGPRGVDVDLQLVGRALDLDVRDAGMREPLLERVAQLEILVQQLRVVRSANQRERHVLLKPSRNPYG